MSVLNIIKRKRWLILGALAFILLGTCMYALFELRLLADRLDSIERQNSLIAAALQSADISPESKRDLQEFANRSGVIARSQEELLTSAVAKAAPAVVSIVITRDVPLLEVQYMDPFGGDPSFGSGIRVPVYRQVGTERRQIGAGTGFFVSQDGYIVTNRHVVSDQEASYTILLSNGEQRSGRVVYRDAEHDLAVVKIDGSGYSSLALSSASLDLGQTVAAIGNALGEYNNSVSVGIVSGLDRTIDATDGRTVERLSGLIQTDAAINRGNSGGPLIDLLGNAVGVNVAVDRSGNDIGFAIPASAVREVLNRAL